jgi:hypothetical protein
LKREEAIDYANGFVTSDLKNRPGEAVPRRVANDLSNNGILEQQVAKRMNGFLLLRWSRLNPANSKSQVFQNNKKGF